MLRENDIPDTSLLSEVVLLPIPREEVYKTWGVRAVVVAVTDGDPSNLSNYRKSEAHVNAVKWMESPHTSTSMGSTGGGYGCTDVDPNGRLGLVKPMKWE